MKNELDSRMILAVFEKIHQHGKVKNDGHILDGVEAFSDFDGYTIFLQDAQVKLSFGFHNQYHYDYQKEEQRQQFEAKLNAIHVNY